MRPRAPRSPTRPARFSSSHGAGTGKTTVITRRIACLIATRRARPPEILALTFTDKAAAEMEERVDTLVPYGYADVQISTFHAFGDRLIMENALELGLTPLAALKCTIWGDVPLTSRAELEELLASDSTEIRR